MNRSKSAIEALIDASVVCTVCGKKQCDCWIWREGLKRYIENPESVWNKKLKKNGRRNAKSDNYK